MTHDDIHPLDLTLAGNDLIIQWSDDSQQQIPIRQLRRKCPCAHCRDKRIKSESESSGLNVLSADQTIPVGIQSMSPVGNYAYTIQFSDGHSSGIFSFAFLRSLKE